MCIGKMTCIRAIITATVACAALGETAAPAAPVCSQGPLCEDLREKIEQLKELKLKRHEDVVQLGRGSEAVKADDQKIRQLYSEDRELRGERRETLQVSDPYRHFRMRKRRRRA